MPKKKKEENMVPSNLIENMNLSMFEGMEGLGFESFGENEYQSPPTIAISHPTSQDFTEEFGVFYRKDSLENLGSELNCSIIHIQRRMRVKTDSFKDSSPCFSSNFITPNPSIKNPYHHTCHVMGRNGPQIVCPYAKWDDKTPPLCEESWIMVLALMDEDNTFNPENACLFYVQRTNMKPAKSFIKKLRTKFRNLPSFGLRIKLQVEKIDGKQQSYFALNFPSITDQDRVFLDDQETLKVLMDSHEFFKSYAESVEEQPPEEEEFEYGANQTQYEPPQPPQHPQYEQTQPQPPQQQEMIPQQQPQQSRPQPQRSKPAGKKNSRWGV